jgi:hypothetical protein
MFKAILKFLGSSVSWIEFGAGAIIAALVIAPIAYEIGHYKGDKAGYDRYKAEQAVANAKVEAVRKQDDAVIRNKDDYTICVDYLRARKLSIDACEQLRGLHDE